MKSKGSSAKDKGKRGERMWRDELKACGWDAKRTGWHQAALGHESKDVTSPEIPIHWEVKFCETMSLAAWKKQVAKDCRDGEIPVIAWKKSYQPWLAMLDARHLLEILKHTDLKALEESLQVK